MSSHHIHQQRQTEPSDKERAGSAQRKSLKHRLDVPISLSQPPWLDSDCANPHDQDTIKK
jgi:hypothetical protein